jgi:hypothetical protein
MKTRVAAGTLIPKYRNSRVNIRVTPAEAEIPQVAASEPRRSIENATVVHPRKTPKLGARIMRYELAD